MKLVMLVTVWAALFALVVPATAEVITVNGTLAGDAMPDGYKYELSVVAVYADNSINFEVVGKSCSLLTEDVLTPDVLASDVLTPDRGCQRQTIKFAPPAGSMSVANKKAYYKLNDKQVYIGDVAGLGNTHWVNLRRGATLEATTTAARVKLDTAILGTGLTQEGRFVLLHTNTR